MNRVPVVILGGFLGSGKTTLLLQMLDESKKRGLNYAVLVNERGKVDLDGLLISKKVESEKIESLLDGCICCTKKSEIAHSIDLLLKNRPDIIFIELTGVANPNEVANVLNEREVIAKVELKSIISMIDAEYLLRSYSEEFQQTLLNQLECASHIVVNKIDLVEKSNIEEIKMMIKDRNSIAQTESAVFGKIQFDQIFKTIFSINKITHLQPKKFSENKAFSSMTTLVLPCDKPLAKEEVENFFTKHTNNIIRGKGFIKIYENGGETAYLIQYSGINRVEWKLEKPERYFLILIGIDLDSSSIKNDWLEINGTQTTKLVNGPK